MVKMKLCFKMMFFLFFTFNVLAQSSSMFKSFEEFVQWENNLKANFHKDYKVPDYYRVGLMISGPENANNRYLFFKYNPQFIEDYENIRNGKLSNFPTDGSTLVKSRFEEMPEDIADYYKQHLSELLSVEGFNLDPVLARKNYIGELDLPKNINKTEWLRTHAWTPNGIIERDNVNYYANAPYAGGYVLLKIDTATGKPIEPSSSNGSSSGSTVGISEGQVKGQLSILQTIQNDILVLESKAKTVRESISLSLKASDSEIASIDCNAGNVPSRFIGRCKELMVIINGYKKLEERAEKVRQIILSSDKSIIFPKIASDLSAFNSVVNKSAIDIFAADKTTPDCTLPSQKGWKCLKTSILTAEGKSYNILLKWNRALKKSKGTVFFGNGGAGMGETLDDAPSKAVLDQLDQLDEVRTVALEMLDANPSFPLAGGYWIHGGGYETLAQIFMSTLELAIKNSLFHGNFLNYLGGSNGSMLLASAMARYNADAYFDRVVFQMGPFLPNLANACDKNSRSSFYLSNTEQVNLLQDFLSRWTFKDPAKSVCSDISKDRLSLLKPGLKKDYPNTIFHVIVGQKEETEGFGKWILASNLEWFNTITAKSKDRIIRPNMAHSHSFEDMRRFVKLAPDQLPDNTLEQCKFGTFEKNGAEVEYHCGCGTIANGTLQADGCFHKVKNN